ncbi:hypothetical protein PCI56_17850 [Plesiomonas shigelloides subsp. oncorhynchi]|nr:hypothetical protein [Plesiomonas shigelloides]
MKGIALEDGSQGKNSDSKQHQRQGNSGASERTGSSYDRLLTVSAGFLPLPPAIMCHK